MISMGSGPSAVVASGGITSAICVRPLGNRAMGGVVRGRVPSTVVNAAKKRTKLRVYLRLLRGNCLSRRNAGLLKVGPRAVGTVEGRRTLQSALRGINRPCMSTGILPASTRYIAFTNRVNFPMLVDPTFAPSFSRPVHYRGTSSVLSNFNDYTRQSLMGRMCMEGYISSCGRIRFITVHSSFNGYVDMDDARGVSDINVRSNSDVIIVPTRALASDRAMELHETTEGVTSCLGVRKDYGIHFTVGSSNDRCVILTIRPRLGHAATLISGTANCPVTRVSTGVTLKCGLCRVGGSVANIAATTGRPTVSCYTMGIPE